MSTLEEFKSAPVGATATEIADGKMAVKTPNKEWPWSLFARAGERIANANNQHMATQGYALDQSPAPKTAREALDITWELAYPVKEGQIITVGTDYIVKNEGNRPATIRSSYTHTVSAIEEEFIRTFDPLTDPLPEWTKAPAVIARPKDDTWVSVWGHCHSHGYDDNCWKSIRESSCRTWQDLRDIEPLYVREDSQS